MKKIFIIASALMLSLSFTSCLKELDNPQKGVIDLDTYYETAGVPETEQLVAAAYTQLFSLKGAGSMNCLDCMSDDVNQGGGTWSDNANKYRSGQEFVLTVDDYPFNTSSRGHRYYNKSYKLIYECNLIIDRIPERDGAPAEMARLKSEARFLRSFAMFELIRWYGNPPFADHLYSQEDMLAPNGDQKEMIDWILKDLETAATGLPTLSGKGQQASIGGRATSHAALAYYGKVALWYASLKYSEGDNATASEYAAKAASKLNTVINSGLYELLPNIFDIHQTAADFSAEYVFEKNCAETGADKKLQADNRHTWRSIRNDNFGIPAGVVQYGWGYILPSPEFVEFMKEHDGEDNVRYKSKIFSYEELLAMDYTSDQKPGIKEGRFQPDCVGYFNRPWLMRQSEVYTDTGNDYYSRANAPLIRYAEVLLWYAEAQFLSNGDADGSGLKALNVVRARAELKPLASMSYQDIKDERRAEFWAEGERFMDLRRWHECGTALKDAGKIRYEFYGFKEDGKTYDIRTIKGEGNGWSDKFYWFPYSTAQLAANPNLKQNPGW